MASVSIQSNPTDKVRRSNVLLLGATGRIGLLTAQRLLDEGVHVRALVRNPSTVPSALAAHPNLELRQENLLSLKEKELAAHISGCDTVILTLGHRSKWCGIPILGFWAPPWSLVYDATVNVCSAIRSLPASATPTRVIQLNTVGVANPDPSQETHVRGWGERFLFSMLYYLTPPYKDSLRSAHYLARDVGTKDPKIDWVAVRPDGFKDGPESEYLVEDKIRHAVFDAEVTTMTNIAHFIGRLVTDQNTWNEWRTKMPIIVDKVQK
ncbi:hypothetical protein DFS34DRAFT_436071 [Phlyctochytrium arcticum]|nr:hypothetical protein DFS34DRAFT_436071 [Phlyctochytrium arcticum]